MGQHERRRQITTVDSSMSGLPLRAILLAQVSGPLLPDRSHGYVTSKSVCESIFTLSSSTEGAFHVPSPNSHFDHHVAPGGES